MASSGDTEHAAPAAGGTGSLARRSRKVEKNSIGAKYYRQRGPKADPNSGRQKRLNKPTKRRTDLEGPQLSKRKKHREAKKQHAITAAETELYRKRNRILALREGGATIQQISQRLTEAGETGVSETSVYKHLAAALDDTIQNYTLNAKQLIQVRLNQMYRVELAHYRRLCETLSADEFEKLSRGMDRIWKRMDTLIDQLTGNAKQSMKVEIPMDTPTGRMETTIRVILPAAPETSEEEDVGT